MHDDEPFLRAILASPGDEDVRAIYADWLDERGETAKAEYLRIDTHGLARLSVGDWSDDGPSGALGSRTLPTYAEALQKWRRDVPRRQQIETLRRSIDPTWWNFMETLGCAPQPFVFFDYQRETPLFAPDAPPFGEPLVARGRVLTFASSFRSGDAWGPGLSADLEMLLRRPATTFASLANNAFAGPPLPFIIDASDHADATDVREVLGLRGGTPGSLTELPSDARRPVFMPTLDRLREAALTVVERVNRGVQAAMFDTLESWLAPHNTTHNDLRGHVEAGGGTIWHGRALCTSEASSNEPPPSMIAFAVGRSLHGPRLLGFLTRVPQMGEMRPL